MGMLAPALGRNVGNCALDELQQRLLDALARNIAGDRRVVTLAGDLVDLVDVDDAALGSRDVEVSRLDQAQQNVLDIFANIAGFGERGGIGNTEGNVEHFGERLSQECLATAGWPDEQNVRLLQLDVVDLHARRYAFVVVVNSNRQHLLGAVLADNVRVQVLVNLGRRRQLGKRQARFGGGWRG